MYNMMLKLQGLLQLYDKCRLNIATVASREQPLKLVLNEKPGYNKKYGDTN